MQPDSGLGIKHQRERYLDVSLREPDREVLNNCGGFVFKISDLNRLERFLIIGSEGGTYYAKEKTILRENVQCLDRIIAAGDGKKALRLIEDVSINRRNIKQSSLLRALAICARCNDKEIKKAAYMIVPKVCRIPTFLFEFIKYCLEESDPGKGWGRAQKKAMSEWYRGFKDNPLKLAQLISKFKNREGWTHKDVLRMAHTKITDSEEVGFILRYIVKGLDPAKEFYMPETRMDEVPGSLQSVYNTLQAYDAALKCHEEDHLIRIIREYKLTWEQCPTQLLKSKEVWKALLPHMPIEATVKNLGRMSAIGLFSENSQEEELIIKKINSINKMSSMQPQDDDSMEVDFVSLRPEINTVETEKPVTKRIGSNFYHPFKILLGMITYKSGQGEKGKLTWTPNQRIVEALDTAFYKAFEHVEPTNKKFYLAIDVSGSMSQPVLGSSVINCATAAAAMMMLTVRTEQDTIVRGFSHVMRDIEVGPDDNLNSVMKKVDSIMMGATDCALPMKDAMEHKIRDVDVFVIYTDNETWFGNVHPTEALEHYRRWSDRKDAKLIVCGMCSTEFTIADRDDKNMLDIVGFDSGAPRVISMFASGQMDKGEK